MNKGYLFFLFSKYTFLYYITLFISSSYGSNLKSNYFKKSFTYFAGVRFDVIQNGNSPNRYIWIHGDEQTAKMALEYHLENYGGTAFMIQNEKREISYKSTIVDPNRIFSRSGAYHALRKFKPGWAKGTLKKALDELDVDRTKFLDLLMPSKEAILISVHNNFRGYNIEHEREKSQRISIKKGQDLRDFFLCTNENDYNILENGPFNVVLQNKLPDKDNDGSLSWEALRRNVRYINVETRLGYLSKQKKMLDYIVKYLN